MHHFGISRPDAIPDAEGQRSRRFDWFEIGKKEKGVSTLTKWTCPECGLNLRVGIKGNPEVIHHPCSEKKGELVFFVRASAMLGLVKP